MPPHKHAPKPVTDTSVQSVGKVLQTHPFQPDVNTNQQAPQRHEGTEALTGGFDLTKMQYDSSSLPISPLGRPLQAKLTIGEPNDKYEQEADRVAHDVVQRIHETGGANDTHHSSDQPQTTSLMANPLHPLQREAIRGDEERLQKKALADLQRFAAGAGTASAEVEQGINNARGSGQSLAPKLQAQMGQAMGADFSGVRVHTDARSDQLNRSVGARAFTTGQDLFFKRGEYQPENRGGQELIAHELTHVVQQGGSSILQAQPSNQMFEKVDGSNNKYSVKYTQRERAGLFTGDDNLTAASDVVPTLKVTNTVQLAYDWWFKQTVLNSQYTDPASVLPVFKKWLQDNKSIKFNDFSVTSENAEEYLKEFYDEQPPDKKVMDWEWKDSILANCYAYAVDDKTPEFGTGKATAKPGGSVGKPAEPQKDPEAYRVAILTGAEADGLKPIEDTVLPNVPPEIEDHRIVAVISDSTGFHWYRRNSNGIWTWKDGNDGKVYNYTLIDGETRVMTDQVAVQAFSDPSKRIGFPNMTFKGYFYAPKGTKVGDKLDR